MGFMDTVKGWFNIGGVKVKIDGVQPTLYVGSNTLTGKAILTAKSDKEVLSVRCTIMNEHKEKKDGEEVVKNRTIDEKTINGFQMKAGETREVEFQLDCHIDEKLQHQGGMMGALGKLGAMAVGTSDTYKLQVNVDVKGVVLDPSDSVDLKIGKR
jgi:hypothetical protein